MARVCGVCNKSPREGEAMRPIRLAKGDRKGEDGKAVEPGLYSACAECVTLHREAVAKRRKCPPSDVSGNDLC